jgi:WD40 repeat protein
LRHALLIVLDGRAERLAALVAGLAAVVIDVASGKQLCQVEAKAIDAIALSADGKTLALAESAKRRIQLVDVSSCRSTTLKNVGRVEAIVFSKDGRWLLTGDAYGIIRRVDPATGKAAAEVGYHHLSISSLTLRDDQRALLSTGRDGTVRLWPNPLGGAP